MVKESVALDNRKKLGELLKTFRDAENLTQQGLADTSGISIRTISSLESGNYERGAKLKTIHKLFFVLNMQSNLVFSQIKKN